MSVDEKFWKDISVYAKMADLRCHYTKGILSATVSVKTNFIKNT
jgi:hypothetical protein